VTTAAKQRSVRRTAVKLAACAALMFGFGYALVPIYYFVCDITGINNLLNPDDAPARLAAATDREVRVELDANADEKIVAMTPKTRVMNLRPGQTYSVIYELKNLKASPVAGQAIPSYAPRRAAQWVKKLQCFCFEQLKMEADETREFPVVFAVSSDLPDDIHTISLSYTFFNVEGAI
jgi:cytochrome c oxidase assembly protein subunit 11